MYISDIVEYNESDNEADILVSDGHYQLLCYVSPVKARIQQLFLCFKKTARIRF